MKEDAGTSATSEVIPGGSGSGEGVDFTVDTEAGELSSPTKPSSRGGTLSVVVRDNAPIPANSCGTGRVAELGAWGRPGRWSAVMGTGKLGENNGVKIFGVSGKVCSPVEEPEEG